MLAILISDALHNLSLKSLSILHLLAIPVDLADTGTLSKLAATSLKFKVVSQCSSFLAPLAVHTILSVIDLHDGGTVDETKLIMALVFKTASPRLIRQPCTTAGSSGELGSPEEFAATHCAVEDPPPSVGTAALGVVNGATRPAGGVAQPGRRSARSPTFTGTAASTPPAAAFQSSSSGNVGLHRSDPYNLSSVLTQIASDLGLGNQMLLGNSIEGFKWKRMEVVEALGAEASRNADPSNLAGFSADCALQALQLRSSVPTQFSANLDGFEAFQSLDSIKRMNEKRLSEVGAPGGEVPANGCLWNLTVFSAEVTPRVFNSLSQRNSEAPIPNVPLRMELSSIFAIDEATSTQSRDIWFGPLICRHPRH